KDSDNDGLPDWEEALYGTDPHNAHSISPTLTDGQAVAEGLIKPQMSIASSSPQNILDSIPGQLPADGSLTQQFSQDF
ncbi:thrombospondin type 3 repeat-containing protein, partial [Pseudomonas aeruginosa]